jgi:hypothetical protein
MMNRGRSQRTLQAEKRAHLDKLRIAQHRQQFRILMEFLTRIDDNHSPTENFVRISQRACTHDVPHGPLV